MAAVPAVFLLIQGGTVGAIIGLVGWSFSLKVTRNPNLSENAKIFRVIGIILASYVVYFIIAIVVYALLSGYK